VKYLTTLRNQAKSAKGWMVVAVLLMLTNMWMATEMVSLATNVPVKLIPYNFSRSKDAVTVYPDGTNSRVYMRQLVLADLKLYTDWMPDTVHWHFSAFLKRASSRIRTDFGKKLNTDAAALKRLGRSQAFLMRDLEVSEDATLFTASGELRKWSGDIELPREVIEYRIRYGWTLGVPTIKTFVVNTTAKGDVGL
jgi:hypothetical protein